MQKHVIFANKGLKIHILKIKNIAKLEIIVIIQVSLYSICYLKYIIPKDITWYIIICSVENTEKHIVFSVPLAKEVIRISKN